MSLSSPMGKTKATVGLSHTKSIEIAKIVLANLRGEKQEVSIADLLPKAFDARFLKEAQHK